MSILSSAEIIAYLGASSYTADIQAIHEGIEDEIQLECGQTFESTSYFQLYDGKGGYYRLELEHTPVTDVSRVSVDWDAVIKIRNTNTDATTASVVINSTNVILTVAGGAGNSTTTLAIADYATLTLLVAAIDALSSTLGWDAELYDNDFAAKKTSLLPAQQIDITSFINTAVYEYLYMGEPITFKLVDNAIEGYFPFGSQNIAVSYTAGTATSSIKRAIYQLVKFAYEQKTGDSEGVKSWRVGEITTEYMSGVDFLPGVSKAIQLNTKVVI